MKTKHIIIIGIIFILSVFLSVIGTLYIAGQTPFISTDSFIGTAVTLIALLVTIIIGYQIYNSIAIKSEQKEFEAGIDSKLEKQNEQLKVFEEKQKVDMISLEDNLNTTYKEKLNSLDNKIAELDILKLQLEYNNIQAKIIQLELKYTRFKKRNQESNPEIFLKGVPILLTRMYNHNLNLESVISKLHLNRIFEADTFLNTSNKAIIEEIYTILKDLYTLSDYNSLLSVCTDLEKQVSNQNEITIRLFSYISAIKEYCENDNKEIFINDNLEKLHSLIEEEAKRRALSQLELKNIKEKAEVKTPA